MAELSPAAQAVDDAFWKTVSDRWNIYDRRRSQLAAALRAVADQVVPSDGSRRTKEIRADILAIATELENQ